METVVRPALAQDFRALGNFLSGMETGFGRLGHCRRPALGNFLSGMETLLLPSPRIDEFNLGNFLSGMETKQSRLAQGPWTFLGNFLSGMETISPGSLRYAFGLPWKLP